MEGLNYLDCIRCRPRLQSCDDEKYVTPSCPPLSSMEWRICCALINFRLISWDATSSPTSVAVPFSNFADVVALILSAPGVFTLASYDRVLTVDQPEEIREGNTASRGRTFLVSNHSRGAPPGRVSQLSHGSYEWIRTLRSSSWMSRIDTLNFQCKFKTGQER